MINRQMTENYIFRWFRCGLSLEKTSQICDVSQETVRRWDRGSRIPKQARTIMEMYSGLRLDHHHKSWKGWKLRGAWLISPYGDRITMEQALWAVLGGAEERELARRGIRRSGWRKKR